VKGISLTLDRTTFTPSETLTGTVSWQNESRRGRSIVIRLFWFTQGKGSEDLECVDERVIDSPPSEGQEAFAFTLPDYPWSYDGTLIAITWAVEAAIEPRGAATRKRFVMAPEAQPVRP
jgi:hypothetical protein